ncbi:MAG TPA: hypothetical protein VHA53_00815, partial [Nitrolancea sp.]|nr:hypothetical protein [Nitrolancea sp.]
GAPAPSVAQSDALPPWLDAAPPMNGSADSPAQEAPSSWPGAANRSNDDSAATFSLISEDDLPEWLRALGDQELEAEPAPAPTAPSMPNGVSHGAPPPTLVAPTISRAWLSRPRAVEHESVDDVAADFVPIEATIRPEPVRVATPAAGTAPEPVAAAPKTPATTVSPPPVESAKPAPRGMRLVLLSAVVVIIVILAFFVLSSVL